jgi:hypothetical protein
MSPALHCSIHTRSQHAVAVLQERRSRDLQEEDEKAAANMCQPDDLIDFAHLKHRRGVAQARARLYLLPQAANRFCTVVLFGPTSERAAS